MLQKQPLVAKQVDSEMHLNPEGRSPRGSVELVLIKFKTTLLVMEPRSLCVPPTSTRWLVLENISPAVEWTVRKLYRHEWHAKDFIDRFQSRVSAAVVPKVFCLMTISKIHLNENEKDLVFCLKLHHQPLDALTSVTNNFKTPVFAVDVVPSSRKAHKHMKVPITDLLS